MAAVSTGVRIGENGISVFEFIQQRVSRPVAVFFTFVAFALFVTMMVSAEFAYHDLFSGVLYQYLAVLNGFVAIAFFLGMCTSFAHGSWAKVAQHHLGMMLMLLCLCVLVFGLILVAAISGAIPDGLELDRDVSIASVTLLVLGLVFEFLFLRTYRIGSGSQAWGLLSFQYLVSVAFVLFVQLPVLVTDVVLDEKGDRVMVAFGLPNFLAGDRHWQKLPRPAVIHADATVSLSLPSAIGSVTVPGSERQELHPVIEIRPWPMNREQYLRLVAMKARQPHYELATSPVGYRVNDLRELIQQSFAKETGGIHAVVRIRDEQ